MSRLTFCLFPLILLAACTDPFISIPGGKLSGEVQGAPDEWGVIPEVIQLEMRPDAPYSVNIWALEDDNNIYVATRNARWVEFIDSDDRVRVRIDGIIYELRAELLKDRQKLENVVEGYIRKYDVDASDDSWVQEGQVYELVPR